MRSVPARKPRIGASVRTIGERFGWGVADQALSSLTNFALGLLAARSLPSPDFGAFAIAFAVYVVALGVVRAITSEPFVIRFAGVATPDWREGAASATGTALAVGVTGGLVCAVTGLLFRGSLGLALVALGLTLPGLLLQDTWRFTFFAARKGGSAFANDLVWTVALAIAVTTILVTEVTSVGWFMAAWGGAGTVAGLFGMVQASLVPAPRHTVRWVQTHGDLVPRFLGEFSLTTGVGQFTTFGLGAIAGLAELAALRAGQILLGPLNVLFLGMNIVAVPEGVRALRRSPRELLRFCRRLSVILSVGALALGAVVWALPDRIGTMILRENWEGGHSVVLPLALGMAFFGVVLGAGVGLRSLAAAKLSLRAKLLVAPFMLGGPLTGAALGGAVGAAWGGTLAIALGIVVWWAHLGKGIREQVREPDTPQAAREEQTIDAVQDERPYA